MSARGLHSVQKRQQRTESETARLQTWQALPLSPDPGRKHASRTHFRAVRTVENGDFAVKYFKAAPTSKLAACR